MSRRLASLTAVMALFAAAPTVAQAAAPRSRTTAAPTRTIKAGGHLIAYRSFGHGSPVLFIEGMGVSMSYWDPQVTEQVARTHRVVLFDLRGVGRSTGSLDEMTIKTMSDDAAALIAALHLRRPTGAPSGSPCRPTARN